MQTVVVIDCCTLGILANPNTSVEQNACWNWASKLRQRGIDIKISGIAAYESRRELIRFSLAAGIAALDHTIDVFGILPTSNEALRVAAQFWADLRLGLRRSVDERRLDADVIVAAEGAVYGQGNGLHVTIATENIRHFQPLVDMGHIHAAMSWQDIPIP